ncbi:MAG: tripartite tricarboxylate transporter TctB family protein [Nitratireductor sp.]
MTARTNKTAISARIVTLKALFKRFRRPGDIVFAWLFVVFSVFLLTQLGSQTTWKDGGKLFAQAPFWPSVAVWLMVVFSTLHLIGSACSPRIAGRWGEVWFWVRSLEYAIWFMAYVFVVPHLGYLASTLLVCVGLALRAGYRDTRALLLAAFAAVVIVVVFKTLLQVKIPGGAIYEGLPQALRAFMINYF